MHVIDLIFAPFKVVSRHLDLLKVTVKSDINQKYAGSILGLSWVFIYPLILFGIYSTLYLVIFRVKPAEMPIHAYLIFILSGLLPFLGFTESLSAGTTSLSAKKALLLNTVYPSEFIPLQAVLSSHVSMLVGLIIVVLAHIVLLHSLPWTLIFVPFLIFLQLLFTVGIVWVLAILNLLTKDVQQALSFLTMLLMIISPIAYTPAMVPASLKLLVYLNPFSYYVWSYQDLFVRGQLTANILIASFISVLSVTVGYLFYNKCKKVFYEFA